MIVRHNDTWFSVLRLSGGLECGALVGHQCGRPRPLHVADSKYNIDGLLETQGKRDEARKLCLECEQILSKEVYGPDHSKTRDAAIGKAGRRVGGVREWGFRVDGYSSIQQFVWHT